MSQSSNQSDPINDFAKELADLVNRYVGTGKLPIQYTASCLDMVKHELLNKHLVIVANQNAIRANINKPPVIDN